ncbi:MAG: hypothetical protein OXG71_11520 [Rhodospirillales bacterium]|nr:hypothetical protein [Rhodospirillales bacterium]
MAHDCGPDHYGLAAARSRYRDVDRTGLWDLLALSPVVAVAAFGIGLFAGALTRTLPGYRGAAHHLMRPGLLEHYGRDVRRTRFWPEV